MKALSRIGWMAALVLAACADPKIPPAAAFAVCGNGKCESGETAANCRDDCSLCKSKPNCDDGNPCTVDNCDALTGCVHQNGNDGSPCDAGPCAENAQCSNGQCSGADRLWQRTVAIDDGQKDFATAMIRLPDGALLAVGNARLDTPPFGPQHDSFSLRIAATAQDPAQVGAKVWVQADKQRHDYLWAMAPVGDGALAVGSQTSLTAGDGQLSRAVWVLLDAAGKTKHADHLTVGGNHAFIGLAAAGNGALLAVGAVGQQALLKRFFADGSESWNFGLSPPTGQYGILRGVAPVGPAGFVAVGRASGAGQQLGWAVGMAGASTQTVFSTELAADSGNLGAVLLAVAAAGDGGALAAGLACAATFTDDCQSSTQRLWLVRLGAAGNVVWQKRAARNVVPLAVLPQADGWLLATQQSDGARLLAIDDAGNELAVTAGFGQVWQGAALLADGTLALAGVVAVNDQADTFLARTDRFGHTNCQDGGACLGKPAGLCADANACTADDCTAAGKCSHAALVGNLLCPDGMCQGILCKSP